MVLGRGALTVKSDNLLHANMKLTRGDVVLEKHPKAQGQGRETVRETWTSPHLLIISINKTRSSMTRMKRDHRPVDRSDDDHDDDDRRRTSLLSPLTLLAGFCATYYLGYTRIESVLTYHYNYYLISVTKCLL